jgi:hypothetical protein
MRIARESAPPRASLHLVRAGAVQLFQRPPVSGTHIGRQELTEKPRLKFQTRLRCSSLSGERRQGADHPSPSCACSAVLIGLATHVGYRRASINEIAILALRSKRAQKISVVP